MATKKVYLNTIAQIAGKISTALISIFLIKILTNYLDVAGYGLYSKVYNYLSIFSVIADLGLYTISVREISRYKDDEEKVKMIAGTILSIRSIMGLCIIVISLMLGAFLPGYNTLPALVGILIAGIFTLFGLVNSSIMSMLQAFLKTEFSFVSTTVGKMVNLISMMLFVYILYPRSEGMLGYDFAHTIMISGVMIAGLFGNMVMTMMLYLYSRKIVKIGFRFDRTYAKHIMTASLPYGLALFLNVLYFKVDVILLSILEPRTIADTSIALYSVPMKIVEVGMMFGTVFLNSMLPLFSEAIKKKEIPSVSPSHERGEQGMGGDGANSELFGYVAKAYKTLLIFGVGIACFLFINSSNVIIFIASQEYIEHSKHFYTSLDAMRIVVFIFLFYFLSSLFTYLLIAHDEQKKLLRINFVITLANLAGNVLLIPYFSFVGSAGVTLVCQILLLGQTYWSTRHLIRFNFLPSFTVSTLFFALIASGINLFLLSLLHTGAFVSLTICTMVFFGVYLGGIGGMRFLANTTHEAGKTSGT
ncbi:MAG: oligosaccharide flippase family protein [Candidatus Gracilibacteria bacterium]|nr:oligosaccharide flippase family protein [Candidatus Gracilibacteria bacterium]